MAPEEAALERARDDLARGIAALAAVHYDPDVAQPDPADWPAAGAPERCPSCRFRGLCEAAPAPLRDERGGPSDEPGTA